jgi:hypothetical protein
MKKDLILTNEKYKAPLTKLYWLQTLWHESGFNFKKFSEYFGSFSIEDFPLINFHISDTLSMINGEVNNSNLYNQFGILRLLENISMKILERSPPNIKLKKHLKVQNFKISY